MRRWGAALVVLALAACAGALPLPPSAAIPLAYHGSWSIDPAYCNFEGDTLDNEMFVSAEAVSFHAETHRVRAVTPADDGVKVDYQPEPHAARQPPALLALSANGALLNGTWHRCPDPQPE